jgi:dsRNA-specific ribonuclease
MLNIVNFVSMHCGVPEEKLIYYEMDTLEYNLSEEIVKSKRSLVLQSVIILYVKKHYPGAPPWQLTKMYQSINRSTFLMDILKKFDLTLNKHIAKHILSVICDFFVDVATSVGDGQDIGVQYAFNVIDALAAGVEIEDIRDYVTELKEIRQKNHLPEPVYTFDHIEAIFIATLKIDDKIFKYSSYKKAFAKQHVAKLAIENIQ